MHTDIDTDAFVAFLVSREIIDQSAAHRVGAASKQAGASVESTVLEFGLADEAELYRALAAFLDWPYLGPEEIEGELAQGLHLPLDFLVRAEIVPAQDRDGSITLALSDPRKSDPVASIAFLLNTSVRPAIATPSAIKQALRNCTPDDIAQSDETSDADVERLTALANDGPVIKMVNDLIAQATDQGASDIHIEAAEAEARVRFRIDGVLVPHGALPVPTFAAVASRLKVMARLNISEKRRPQDGRTHVSVRGRTVDIRLSTLPTQHGESLVMRLLDRSRVDLNWASLEFEPEQAAKIERAVNAPNGVFLVAGPTGSGKTTTLYTALNGINSTDRKIVTVEDPIEYTLPGINQVQVETEVEMSFARALRAILRQDPDVIMVGEIRDEETAEIAIRAALVGRMVLSTIHTNDALSAVVRLRDLGVPPYLLAATLRGILSQRLLRRVCPDCTGNGCGHCNASGQRGRIVLSEFLEITPDLAAAISRDCGLDDLRAAARSNGFVPMSENAKLLVENGDTTQEEALRIVGL